MLALIPPGFTYPPKPSAPTAPKAAPSIPAAPVAAPAAAGGIGALGLGAAAAGAIILNLLFPSPAADADLDDLMPPEPAQEVQPPVYPFTGGQSLGVKYDVRIYSRYGNVEGSGWWAQYYGPVWGPVVGIEVYSTQTHGFVADFVYGIDREGNLGRTTLFATNDKNPAARILEVKRFDNLADTGGNPPATQPEIKSAPGNQTKTPQAFTPSQPTAPAAPPEVKPPIAPSIAPASPTQPEEEKPKAPVQPQNPVNPFAPAPQPQTPQPQTPGGDPETNPPVAPAPSPSATPNAIPGTSSQPGILIGPAANPGTTQITFPSPGSAFGANPVPVQNFVPSPAGDPIPQPSPIAPPAPITPPTIQPAPEPTQTEKKEKSLEEKFREFLITSAGVTNLLNPIFRNTTPQALTPLIENAVCNTTKTGGCSSNAMNNAASNAATKSKNDLLDKLGLAEQSADLLLLGVMNEKLGAQMPGGLSSGIGRMSKFLGIDRVLNLLNTLAILHNAMMLSASLKITLLEMLSSVGNATGLLQTSEGDNVDLNQVFNNGVEGLITHLIGAENFASLKLSWRKHSTIFRIGNNVLSNVGNMFSSIGNGIEVIGERTGKIGNALRAAGVVRENAYNFMSENMTVHTNKFMTFQTKIGGVAEVLETINEVAESTIEGQQSYTEAVKATEEFKKSLETGTKENSKDVQNAAIKAEADKIKENLVKDPTGEDEQGLLSFLTDR